jgi:hypothetical protein
MKKLLIAAALGGVATTTVPAMAAPVDILNRKSERRERPESPRVEKPRETTPPSPTGNNGSSSRPSRPEGGGGINIGRPVVRPADPRPDRGNGPGRGNGPDRGNWPGRNDRDRDRDRYRNRPSFNWNYGNNRTVIVDRQVYVPYSLPPIYGNGYYNDYDYSRYYTDREYERQLDELEVIARQIKTALRLDPVLGRFNLDTDTVGESIEIEGFVESPSHLQRVLDVAREIDRNVRVVITRVRLR